MTRTTTAAIAPAGSAAFVQRALAWLERSERPGGGSSAFFVPLFGWSRAYPETTGYICATLVDAAQRLNSPQSLHLARRFGNWLLSIQETEGCWRAGKYPYDSNASPSIFNTGQILFGLCALARVEPNGPWLDGARAAANWLAAGVGPDGEWANGHYRKHQPAYYAHVSWPMLECWKLTDEGAVRKAAERVLARTIAGARPNGAIEGWGFEPDGPAFSHTIAYTLQGLMESSRLTGAPEWREAALPALERLRRVAEVNDGRLPGSFTLEWQADKSYECMTGSAQIAACFLLAHQTDSDLRWVNAAAKLVDRVMATEGGMIGLNPYGCIPGSVPLWGKYMSFRYPNWAVKFAIDAVFRLSDSLAAFDD